MTPQHYPSLTQPQRRTLRLAYVEAQAGLCAYCQAPLAGEPDPRLSKVPVNPELFPPGFFKSPVHLHHNHTTGMTIGAIHARCNAILWQYHGE